MLQKTTITSSSFYGHGTPVKLIAFMSSSRPILKFRIYLYIKIKKSQ